jgi:hypothetical protein
MKKFHTVALIAASTAFLGLGIASAVAQNVTGADPYQQGYAAGASAKERNSFGAFDSGYRAGQTDQTNAGDQAASAQAYNTGYQAGLARSNHATQQAYNEGYQSRVTEDRNVTARAFDNGYDAGASRQAHYDDEFP